MPTTEMLSNPVYMRMLQQQSDQNAWQNMWKQGSELAQQHPWTTLGQALGTYWGWNWGKNEWIANYNRNMNAMQEKKYQDALNTPIVGMTAKEAFDLMNKSLPKNLQAPIEHVAAQNLANQANNPVQAPINNLPQQQNQTPKSFLDLSNPNSASEIFAQSVENPNKYNFSNLNFGKWTPTSRAIKYLNGQENYF